MSQVNQFNYRDPPHLSDPFSDSIGIVFVTALAWGWAVRLQISRHLTNPFLKTSHVGMGTVFMVCVWLGVAPFCAHIFGNKFPLSGGVRSRVWCVLGWGAVEGSSCGLGFGVVPAMNCVSHRVWAGPWTGAGLGLLDADLNFAEFILAEMFGVYSRSWVV